MTDLTFNTSNSDISAGSGSVSADGGTIGPAGGADEIQFTDGTDFTSTSDFTFDAVSGNLSIGVSGSPNITLSSGNPAVVGAPNRDVVLIGGSGSFDTARGYIEIQNGSDTTLKASDGSSGNGRDVLIIGGEADGVSGDGGNIVLTPGSPNGGSGVDGKVVVHTLEVTSATLQTTSNSTLTLETVPIPTDEERVIVSRIRGNEAATGDTLWSFIRVGVKNVSGTVSVVGSAAEDTDGDAGTSTWGGVSITASGSDALIQVTGDTSTTIDWISTTEVS